MTTADTELDWRALIEDGVRYGDNWEPMFREGGQPYVDFLMVMTTARARQFRSSAALHNAFVSRCVDWRAFHARLALGEDPSSVARDLPP